MIWGMAARMENCFNSFEKIWKEIIGVDWDEWVDQCGNSKTILIIDETQLIYKEKQDGIKEGSANSFWLFIKGLLQEISVIFIIIFADYAFSISEWRERLRPITLDPSPCKNLC